MSYDLITGQKRKIGYMGNQKDFVITLIKNSLYTLTRIYYPKHGSKGLFGSSENTKSTLLRGTYSNEPDTYPGVFNRCQDKVRTYYILFDESRVKNINGMFVCVHSVCV